MTTTAKWTDLNDEETYLPEEVKPIHKKLIRKNPNLASELNLYHKSKTNSEFTKWATASKESALKKSSAAKILTSDFTDSKAKSSPTAIKKFVQTTFEDSIHSVIQSIDSYPNSQLVSFAGLDKILKIIKIDLRIT